MKWSGNGPTLLGDIAMDFDICRDVLDASGNNRIRPPPLFQRYRIQTSHKRLQ